jgi:hypothetical protein
MTWCLGTGAALHVPPSSSHILLDYKVGVTFSFNLHNECLSPNWVHSALPPLLA